MAMDQEARRAVVAALVRLAGSSDYQDRADAGVAMAGFAEMPEAIQPLSQFLLDAADTFVTWATAEALLRRKDLTGLTLVARALADADDNHAGWIVAAVRDVFMIYASERAAAVRACDVLINDPDPRHRRGAVQLRGTLVAIDPILHPAGETWARSTGSGQPQHPLLPPSECTSAGQV